ncbi:FAD/NAD(P)-binding protein [Leucobacter sp. GX24907]
MAEDRGSAVRIVSIGAGPAAVMILERIVAIHARDTPDLELDVILIDPHEPGGGRIWRRSQSPLLKLNSMMRDVAVFTDASCELYGPVEPGPSLWEWVERVRGGDIARPDWWDELLEREIEVATGESFPTRRLNNAYMAWMFEEVLDRAAPSLKARWLRDSAIAVEHSGPGHEVRLASGSAVEADIVIHAVGHNGSDPSGESIALTDFAERHGLGYVAPAFTADIDYEWLPAGADVIVRGMGLAAVDLVVMLTEGRGGRHVLQGDGSLRYIPSGREPILHLGSRRGVPYRSKITSRLVGDPVHLEYLGQGFHERVGDAEGSLDFERDVWPLVVAELTTGFYRELFTGHPERVLAEWPTFSAELRTVLTRPEGFRSREFFELVQRSVPNPDDRFDIDSFDRPLAGDPWGDLGAHVDAGLHAVPRTESRAEGELRPEQVDRRVREHIAMDLRHRTTQEHSATQGLFMTMLFSYLSIAEVRPEAWNARSRTWALPRRWLTFFSYLASGPPGHRLEEFLALSEAGVLSFLGGDLELEADEETGRFTATGRVATPEGPVRSSVTTELLIDAWLPPATAATSDNPLLRQLITGGHARELAVVDDEHSGSTGQIVVAPGGKLPGTHRQFALGPFTSTATSGAFTRPGLNSLPFRRHDRFAREVLESAREVRDERVADVLVELDERTERVRTSYR